MNNQLTKSAIRYHNTIQLQYFDNKIKKTMVPVDSYYVNRHIDEFIKFSGIKRTDKILEVGCGMGKFTFPLLKRGYKIMGLDLSPFLLQKLLEYNNNTFDIELISSDILEIPDDYNESFDFVIGFFTLHHFQHLHTYFQAMRRILRPGGSIVFVEPNAFNPLYYFQIFLSPNMSWAGDKGVAKMHKKNFLNAAKYADLSNLKMKKYGFFPPFLVNTSIGRQTENLIEKLKIFRSLSAFQIIRLTK